jgi:hypothetical protein
VSEHSIDHLLTHLGFWVVEVTISHLLAQQGGGCGRSTTDLVVLVGPAATAPLPFVPYVLQATSKSRDFALSEKVMLRA